MAKGKKTGGRVAGTPNKATGDLKLLCQAYTEEAVTELHRLATAAVSEQARVGAIRELLDRGYGKPAQSLAIGQDENSGPLVIRWESD